MKKLLVLAVALVLTAGGAVAVLAVDEMSWTGEVLDLGCYEKGQKGAGHAACAVKCLEGGAAMGLLVDGEVVKVDAAGSDAAALKTLKSLGGKNAMVTGTLADGVVKVSKAEAAG